MRRDASLEYSPRGRVIDIRLIPMYCGLDGETLNIGCDARSLHRIKSAENVFMAVHQPLPVRREVQLQDVITSHFRTSASSLLLLYFRRFHRAAPPLPPLRLSREQLRPCSPALPSSQYLLRLFDDLGLPPSVLLC